MKKLLLIVGIIVGCVLLIGWVASWFRAPEAVATSAAKPWPGPLGRLDQAPARVKPLEANQASAKLTALGTALPKNDPLDDFVLREMSRRELMIGTPPPAIADTVAIRDLLLTQPVSWDTREDIGDTVLIERRAMLMTIARNLLASALVKGRANDAAAWRDLEAIWKLARSLDEHPQVMAQTASLAMGRMINAVAWKMPLPAPPWFAELQARDHVQPLLDAFQVQSASYWKDGMQLFPTKMLANDVEHDRQIAEELYKTTKCDVEMRPNKLGVDLRAVWRRAFRYRAEREATANAIRVREGKPIVPLSRCSDGAWSFDGTTLRFSREIPTALPDRPMPLVLHLKQ